MRIKFKCDSVNVNGEGKKAVILNPVHVPGSPDPDNSNYWTDVVPNGQLNLALLNDSVDIKVGQEYFLDIIPATAAE